MIQTVKRSTCFKLPALSLLLAFAPVFHSPVSAQEAPARRPAPQQSEDVIRVDTALMQAGVTVLDKQGRFVKGLDAEQFEVLVDGKPQAISFFEYVAASGPEERAKLAAAGDARAAAAKRTGDAVWAQGRSVIFFLDDLHMSAESMGNARKLIQYFVDKEMGDDDVAAIGSASGQLGFLQQLTGNREVLRAAVSRLRPRSQLRGDGEQPLMTEYIAKAIDVENDRGAIEPYVQVLVREGVRPKVAEDVVKARARAILQLANADTRNTLRSLAGMVRAVSSMPGRKLAFFLSDGFLLSRNDSDVSDSLRRVTDAAVRGGVVLYTLDTRGIATESWLDLSAGARPPDGGGQLARVEVGEMTASQEALHMLAEQTGGRAILNNNAQAGALSRTVNETAAYYLLAWRVPGGEQQGKKFHHLEVAVKDRPGLIVLVQRGFLEDAAGSSVKGYAGRRKAKPPTRDGELNAALASLLPVRDVPAHLALGYSLTEKGETIMTALVSVPVDVLSLDQTGKAAVEVVGYVVNLDGKIGSRFGERLNLKPKQSPKPDAREHILYRHQIKVTPGLYQVRTAAWDANSGRAGSAAEWIEIPDLKSGRLALGSLIVGERPEETGQPYNAENFVNQRSAESRFTRDAHLRFMTYIYNAAPGTQGALPELEAQVQVLRGGKPVLTYEGMKVDPGTNDPRGIAYGVELPLDTLSPGSYVLQISVTDKVARATASGRTFFIVE